VPEGRAERIAKLGSMLAGIAGETALEALRRAAGRGDTAGSLLLNPANARRFVDTLADLRGAAMKLGQLLSMQGQELLPGPLSEILSELQNQAHLMPDTQVRDVLKRELGSGWERRFAEFDFEPLAAASIGQVHAAEASDGRDLAVKVQYPGVERSIAADVENLVVLLRMTRLLPPEVDLEDLAPELIRELRREADYRREARNTERYRELVGSDPGVLVPRVHADLSTTRVLATDRVRALPIEDLRSAEHSQDRRDAIGEKLLRLVFRELFEFRFVQTDPNFANYLFEPKHERVALLDFGAVRSLSRRFSAAYRRLVIATVEADLARVVSIGQEIGFLRGAESGDAEHAFVELCGLIAEPLRGVGAYDFASTDLAERARSVGLDAYKRRGLPQPPTELILVQRKIAGSYLLLAHIGARVDCGALYRECLL
jgi:predicted unusual protein kinase regulating ubiquinone biosynthesis (AarF/ABC1/UbiB family)